MRMIRRSVVIGWNCLAPPTRYCRIRLRYNPTDAVARSSSEAVRNIIAWRHAFTCCCSWSACDDQFVYIYRADFHVAEKNPKVCLNKWSLIGKISQFRPERIHEDANSRSVFNFHGNRPKGSRCNDALLWWQKVRKMQLFASIFAPVWLGAPEVCRRACHLSRHLLVKFRPNRFRFALVISENGFRIYDRNVMKPIQKQRRKRKWVHSDRYSGITEKKSRTVDKQNDLGFSACVKASETVSFFWHLLYA